ncbi:MAG: TetR/AcrR family transcriptional regulator [Bacteroidota bacterium]
MPRTKAFDQQDVLQKAVALFWKQGYEATSMQDLVDHLGISRSSLYETFGDKENLYKQALKAYRDQGTHRLENQWNPDKTFTQNLRALFNAVIQEADLDPEAKGCFLVNAGIELAHTQPDVFNQVKENQENTIAFFKRKIIEAKLANQLPGKQHATELAALVYNSYAGLQVLARSKSDTNTMKNAVSALLDLLE